MYVKNAKECVVCKSVVIKTAFDLKIRTSFCKTFVGIINSLTTVYHELYIASKKRLNRTIL